MMTLLSGIDLTRYKHREYIVADTDLMSIQKVHQFESGKGKDYSITTIKRSRHVGQSYFTSIFTTILATLYSIPLLFKIRPSILLVNGPGTCLPICLLIFVLSRCLFILPKCKIIFVESICRVKTLSLTGQILYRLRIANSFIVQWPELQTKYPNAIYMGRLV
jgi:beta-1,4-N-acetylglucosaminyltransferase